MLSAVSDVKGAGFNINLRHKVNQEETEKENGTQSRQLTRNTAEMKNIITHLETQTFIFFFHLPLKTDQCGS